MLGKSRRSGRYDHAHPPTKEREAIERRWYPRLRSEPGLAALVTAGSAKQEPFHRWMRYRQGFSPELVRMFLTESGVPKGKKAIRPVLDPFSGAGTTVIECARHAMPAAGVETQEALVFLTASRFMRELPELTEWPDSRDGRDIAAQLSEPAHRAALMLAVAARHTLEGKPAKDAPPFRQSLQCVLDMMKEDVLHPLPDCGRVAQGDARRLAAYEDESVRGVLTSPPYLSRYDYSKIILPVERIYRTWYPRAIPRDRIRIAMQSAAPKGNAGPPEVSPAVDEASKALSAGHEPDLASMVENYFEDLQCVLRELRRVLPAGAPCWVVIGGARLKGVYVPSDLIAAECAEEHGFRIAQIRVARHLIEAGRKMGTLQNIRPRESLLQLTAV